MYVLSWKAPDFLDGAGEPEVTVASLVAEVARRGSLVLVVSRVVAYLRVKEMRLRHWLQTGRIRGCSIVPAVRRDHVDLSLRCDVREALLPA